MRKKLSFCVVFSLFTIWNTSLFANQPANTTSDENRYSEIAKNLEIFTSLFRELNTYYVDDIDPNTAITDAIDGMLENLDPYTNYISSSDIDEYQFQTTGKYGGIGATISEIKGKVFIREPYEGSPAQKAGLQAGDEILEIDGKSADKKGSEDIRLLLRGQPNTPVQIKVKRAVSGKILTFNFKREEINVGSVPYFGMLKGGVGYIKLDQFTDGCSKDVANALKTLKSKNDLKGIVLDLRGNPGGLLNEAINICNLFIDKGLEVVQTKGKIESTNKKYETQNKPMDTSTPLAILTDGGSASASEIVTGVMQDYDRAVVVGQRTFGKGLVQITRPLPYKSSLKVTTYKYYIPSGRCIQAIDYSHRDEDGEAVTIPDSLRKVFYTKDGRPVKDGAGIEPDVKMEAEKIPMIAVALFSKNLFFDYANIYKDAHPQIDTEQTFSLSEKDYQGFLDFIKDKDYDYTTKTEKMLNDLIKTAKKESYYDGIADALDTLEKNMKHDKNKDLIKYKEDIKSLLEGEIATRYQYQKGRILVNLKYDDEVDKAISILDNPAEYHKLLTVSK